MSWLMADEFIHPVDYEFMLLLNEFREHGGFSTPCPEEYWERHHRQSATCVHGYPLLRCVKCRKPAPSYWPQA